MQFGNHSKGPAQAIQLDWREDARLLLSEATYRGCVANSRDSLKSLPGRRSEVDMKCLRVAKKPFPRVAECNAFPPSKLNSLLPRGLCPLYFLGLGTFLAGDDFENDFITFTQGLEAFSQDCSVMHKNILPRILGDEAQALHIVPPFDFAFSHNCLLNTTRTPAAKKQRTSTRRGDVRINSGT